MRLLEFLVEELSAEAAPNEILPRVIGDRASFATRPHEGYPALLRHLPARLAGYRERILDGEDIKVVVLVDEDRDPAGCEDRKANLERIARGAGLPTKTAPDGAGVFRVVNRVAVEELEAWFFGDLNAVREAYPRVSNRIFRRAAYHDPDAIAGGTSRKLLRELQNAGYYPGLSRLPKIEVAQSIASNMDPQQNRSKSFRVFMSGVTSALA